MQILAEAAPLPRPGVWRQRAERRHRLSTAAFPACRRPAGNRIRRPDRAVARYAGHCTRMMPYTASPNTGSITRARASAGTFCRGIPSAGGRVQPLEVRASFFRLTPQLGGGKLRAQSATADVRQLLELGRREHRDRPWPISSAEIQQYTGILDFERGREDRLVPYPWLTDTVRPNGSTSAARIPLGGRHDRRAGRHRCQERLHVAGRQPRGRRHDTRPARRCCWPWAGG